MDDIKAVAVIIAGGERAEFISAMLNPEQLPVHHVSGQAQQSARGFKQCGDRTSGWVRALNTGRLAVRQPKQISAISTNIS